VAKQNDLIFQLSLTEIAFILTFILLFLLGYLVFKEETGRLKAEAALAKVQTTEQATAVLDTAKSTLVAVLNEAGAPNPDAVISNLISASEVRAERDNLKKKVEDLDAKLTALSELQNKIENAAKSRRPDITKEEIDLALTLQEAVRKDIEDHADDKKQALTADATPKLSNEQRNMAALERVKQAVAVTGELKKQLKKQLDMDLSPGKEIQTVQELVSSAKSYGDLGKSSLSPEAIKRENSDLRGQVAFLKNRLDARGGRDFPPCWADESGKAEFLFAIELKSDSVFATPAWPSRREAAARALPGITKVLAGPYSNQAFVSNIQGVFNWSKKQDPECRHYIQMKSSISDAVQSDRARLMVERYFYKVEVRR
jgi:hypothetical protein